MEVNKLVLLIKKPIKILITKIIKHKMITLIKIAIKDLKLMDLVMIKVTPKTNHNMQHNNTKILMTYQFIINNQINME
jgi:hypothetical protein